MNEPSSPESQADQRVRTAMIRVRSHRQSLGISQELIAGVCGVSRAMVSQWDTGKSQIKLHHFVRYANALGLKPGDLLQEEPEEEKEDLSLTRAVLARVKSDLDDRTEDGGSAS